MTVGGASAIPGLGLPPVALAWGLFIAGIAKAVASELVQPKGASDEVQGIAPAQVAAAKAIHDAAAAPPATPPASTAAKVGVLFLCLGICFGTAGCKSDATTTAVQSDAVVITGVNAAMSAWANYVNSGKASPQSIVTVSNVYNLYYQSQLIASNAAVIYAQNPSTNTAAIEQNALAAAIASQSNVVNIVNQLMKKGQ